MGLELGLGLVSTRTPDTQEWVCTSVSRRVCNTQGTSTQRGRQLFWRMEALGPGLGTEWWLCECLCEARGVDNFGFSRSPWVEVWRSHCPCSTRRSCTQTCPRVRNLWAPRDQGPRSGTVTVYKTRWCCSSFSGTRPSCRTWSRTSPPRVVSRPRCTCRECVEAPSSARQDTT